MMRVVFSKQADADIDSAPLWLWWYREVFKADTIIITPVKLPSSQIVQTEAFYLANDCNVIPLRFDSWNVSKVWQAQLQVIRPMLALDKLEADFGSSAPGLLVVSADADQLLEPVHDRDPWCREGSCQLFRRVGLVAEAPPTRENLSWLKIEGAVDTARVAGFRDRFDDTGVGVTGHASSTYASAPAHHTEWHFALRGFDHFVRKVRSLTMDLNTSPRVSGHWKRWVETYRTKGEDGLRADYDGLRKRLRQGADATKAIARFRELGAG
jgi:hypothetical protein